MKELFSISPDGTKHPLPDAKDFQIELKRIKKLVEKTRREKKEIVVVMGVGFVGAVTPKRLS